MRAGRIEPDSNVNDLKLGDLRSADLARLRALHEQLEAALHGLAALINGTSRSGAPRPRLSTAARAALVLTQPTIEVRLLGPFEVVVAGQPVPLRSSGKPVAVLKYMAAMGDQAIPRDAMLDALWPGVPAAAAGSRLRAAMHGLRRMFAEGTSGSIEVLGYEFGRYRLFPGGPFETDASRFESAWERGRRHDRAGEVDDAIAAYAEADGLYRGDFLENDPYAEWTLLRREQLRDIHLTLLTRLANLHLGLGDDVTAISLCHKIVRRDECNDEAYRILVTAHGRRGERAAAERWFEIGDRALRTALNIGLSTTTRRALERMREETAASDESPQSPKEAVIPLTGRARAFAQIEERRRG
jgi:DNA-binding SARP family transcriptional activator